MAVIAFPSTFRVSGARFTREVPRSRSVSPFSGKVQVYVWSSGFWRAELPLVVHAPAAADAIDAFLDQLRSEENVVQFAGTDFNRVNGPGTLNWTLAPDSPSSLPRGQAGFSDPVSLTFREVV